MSTPAFIGIQVNLQGLIKGITCNFGDLVITGRKLFEHYDREELKKLLDLGDISSLGSTLDDTVAYRRDMKREDNYGKLYRSMKQVRERSGYYMYFLFVEGQWQVSEGGKFFHPLEDALKQMEVING